MGVDAPAQPAAVLVITADYARDQWPALLSEVASGLTVRVVDGARSRRECAVITPGSGSRLALSDLDGLGTREAAGLAGIAPATVRSRRRRAKITTTGAST